MKYLNVLKMKYSWILIIGMILIGLIFEFNDYTRYYYIQNNKIQKSFNEIKNNELLLNYNILVTSLYMYNNNDDLIYSVNKLEKSIKRLLKNRYFKENYNYVYSEMEDYQKLIQQKTEYVYEFQTLNSAIKNSTMYLASLLNDLPKLNMYKIKHTFNKNVFENNILYAQKIIQIISNIFLAKSSFDKDFINSLDIGYFKKITPHDKEFKKFNTVFIAHLTIFKKFFPKFVEIQKKALDKNTVSVLDEIYQNYFEIMNGKLVIIKWVSYLIIIFIVVSVAVIIFLLKQLEEEYSRLQRVNNELYLSYITDKLTGLFNRNKFDEDIKRFKEPALLLVNIDRFKHINDYYGTKTGDLFLKKIANILTGLVPQKVNASFYRLGADDFGILFEKSRYSDIRGLARKIIKYFDENEIEIKNFKFHISVSIGISAKAPFIENADIALKNVKKSFRKKFMVYEEAMNAKQEIKQNFEKTSILYKAIKDNRIEPYFQPIVDTETKKTIKYEVLARVVHKNGEAESIYPYLQIAKDNKLYAEITKIMMQKTYVKVRKLDTDVSINVSIEDILDVNIIKFMYKLYLSNRDLAKRTTFEILESEAVEDYEEIRKFLQRVKYYGSKVAIDDFGSGYSNFEHLVNLNVDYIKIDGSLIKKLDENQNAYKIVKVIADFAKEINVKTVAEFVANENVYKKVKKLGIDYSQGYYFSEPKPFFT